MTETARTQLPQPSSVTRILNSASLFLGALSGCIGRPGQVQC